MNVVECQVNIKSQSELDIGGRETCVLFLDSFPLFFHPDLLGMKSSEYLEKSRNAQTLDYHQAHYTACEIFIFSQKVTGLISAPGLCSLCDQREFPGQHCHSLLIDGTDKNLFDANYLQNMFFTLCNFTS